VNPDGTEHPSRKPVARERKKRETKREKKRENGKKGY
jgi:hypothetical protein